MIHLRVLVVALGLCTGLISLLQWLPYQPLLLASKLLPYNPPEYIRCCVKRSFQSISFGRFQSSKRLRLQISCAAKPETVQKVSDIVNEQLALSTHCPAQRVGYISSCLGSLDHISQFYITNFYYLYICNISLGPKRNF
ncbi:uncharacterized protein LOC125591771 [Brassica napus]|uniref:uncharacterized protein LOC125591771 n=1 Tax=Brassica napus TaxID=3708 RepID=UPI00207A58A3|nr:uncharacterized protein LOC125591771 [Brassica napus]